MKLQPSTCNLMNNELFHRCFRDKYLRNNASVLIHIARKRHFIFAKDYFLNSQDKILCADFALSTS